ncbi:hypothetical protein GCM10022419_124310 [Nonomuraea rosea]|uniref:Tn3 transposase DDE domain-containing protein n=1 Tax=Nonomuraea rosea TaxID=638574 RepID=A0ABP6ZRG3_9ACTN
MPVKDEDVARLSPLGHAHLNCLGRYAIASSAPDKGLRPLEAAELPEASAARHYRCRGRGRRLKRGPFESRVPCTRASVGPPPWSSSSA